MFKVNSELAAKVVKVNTSQVIEIQNFYDNPDAVREYSLSSKKYTKEENEDLLAAAIGRRVCEDTLELLTIFKMFLESCVYILDGILILIKNSLIICGLE